jgi:hypothetical protein
MRFKKRERYGAFEDTTRKRAAAGRAQQKQRDALPLFAEQIAEAQPSIDQVMAGRAAQWEKVEAQQRSSRAAAWREARRRLARFDDTTRGVVLAYWNGHRWLPGDPSYLLDTMHSFERGRLVLDGGTLRPAQIVLPPRQRRNPPPAG